MIFGTCIQNYFELLKQNLRLNTIPNMRISILFLCFIPIIRGISNLNSIYSAECLEKSVALIGIILLAPICYPEQDKQIFEVVLSKTFAFYKIFLIRFFLSLITLSICIIGFISIMISFNCIFPVMPYILGTLASAFALGGFGILAATLSNNVIIGYIVSIGYFLLNWLEVISNGNILFLFSMSNGSYDGKWNLALCGLLCFGVSLIFKTYVAKK